MMKYKINKVFWRRKFVLPKIKQFWNSLQCVWFFRTFRDRVQLGYRVKDHRVGKGRDTGQSSDATSSLKDDIIRAAGQVLAFFAHIFTSQQMTCLALVCRCRLAVNGSQFTVSERLQLRTRFNLQSDRIICLRIISTHALRLISLARKRVWQCSV